MWLDAQLQAGQNWREEIDKAIKESAALIVIATPDARASEYVTYEWAFALGMEIPVVPILLKATELHPRLEALQYLDFTNRNSRPWEALFHRLNQFGYDTKPISIQRRKTNNDPIESILLETLHDDPSTTNRIKAARTLETMQNKAAIPEFLRILFKYNESYLLRIAVAEILSEIGDLTIADKLLLVLQDETTEIQIAAAKALGRLKYEPAIPHLVKMLEHSEETVSYAASAALAEIDPDSFGIPF